MTNKCHVRNYALLILDQMVRRASSIKELRKLVDDYPEDFKREGHVREGLREYIDRVGSFPEILRQVGEEIKNQGGRGELDDDRDIHDFNEFMAGWDD